MTPRYTEDTSRSDLPRVVPTRSEICENTHAGLRTTKSETTTRGRESVAGSGGIGVSIGDRKRALSRASVDRLITAGRGGSRRCGRDREGVVQPRVQDSHPRRQCHFARGRGATREPIAGALSSSCAQSAPGQGKLLVLIGDIGGKIPQFFNQTGLNPSKCV